MVRSDAEAMTDMFLHAVPNDAMLLKRGSDELLSQSGAVSNGAVMSPQPNHADNNNDAKKCCKDGFGAR
ncbi:UNVERIFIED_CONTAM: hypothetical protein B566_EDAN017001 [Ephemera danica]|nr:hypothetical protein B566_EDAN017001 [Ephemera danica]